MDAGEEIYEVSGRASGKILDGIGEIGDSASEVKAVEVYGAGFSADSH